MAVLEAILAERAGLGRTESWLEHRTLEVLRDGGLPLPLCQRRIRQKGAFAARVDFLYPDAAVVIEVDGHGGHSTKAQRRRDPERRPPTPPATLAATAFGGHCHDVRLILAGFRPLCFTYDDVVARPGFVCSVVAEALSVALPAS